MSRLKEILGKGLDEMSIEELTNALTQARVKRAKSKKVVTNEAIRASLVKQYGEELGEKYFGVYLKTLQERTGDEHSTSDSSR